MKISADGRHILQQVTGVSLDRQLVMPNAGLDGGGGDFLDTSIRFYGGWNTPTIGQFTAPLVAPVPVYLAEADAANVIAFWTDGHTRWIGQYADGAQDSEGNRWPDRNPLGSSRQGDWLFVEKPSFTTLIVRAANGIEHPYPFGQYFTLGGMDRGLICVNVQGRGTLLWRVPGPVPSTPLPLPNTTPITVDAFQDVWSAGYQPGWGLCLCRLDQAPAGYLLSNDERDFYPAIQRRDDGQILVATGENQGETIARTYLIDPTGLTVSVNGAAAVPLVPIDITAPPVTVTFQSPVLVAPFFPSR